MTLWLLIVLGAYPISDRGNQPTIGGEYKTKTECIATMTEFINVDKDNHRAYCVQGVIK